MLPVFGTNPSPLVIPTENRTTLSEAEGDVRLSGGTRHFVLCHAASGSSIKTIFTCPRQMYSCLPGSFPLEMPSRNPRPRATSHHFVLLALDLIRDGDRICAAEWRDPDTLSSAMPHQGVLPKQRPSTKITGRRISQSRNFPAPEARREVSPP